MGLFIRRKMGLLAGIIWFTVYPRTLDIQENTTPA